MIMFKKCGGIHREKGLARKWPEPLGRRVTVRLGPVTEQVVESNDPLIRLWRWNRVFRNVGI